jgi:hypothetical protein
MGEGKEELPFYSSHETSPWPSTSTENFWKTPQGYSQKE